MSKPTSHQPSRAAGDAERGAVDSRDGAAEGRSEKAAGATRAPSEGSDEEMIGVVIDGRYRVLSFIGRGGMGSVYRAEHVTIKRVVAVKLLHRTLVGVPEIGKRFEREAYAIGRIDHPNCVNVSDFGQLEDGSLYLVMEYLEGRSRGDLLVTESRVPPRRALHIIRHVIRGLGHAHEAGIVHRDVKPENVLLIESEDDTEFAKILDFGIAKLLGQAAADDDSDHKLTQAGVAFGTPIYMSPEQAVGSPVDGRADLYAATVLLYEMITGRPPFYSDDKIEVLAMHTSKQPAPLARVAADVALPPGLDEIIARGLAKRPRDRYQNAAQMVEAIDQVLRETDAVGQPPPRAPSLPGDSGQHVRVPRKGQGTVPVVYGGTGPTSTLPPEMTAGNPVQTTGKSWIIAAVVGAVAVIGVLVALAAGGDAGVAGSDAGVSSSVDERPLAERAAKMLQRGNPQEAIDLLLAHHDDIREDGPALLQLAHAHAAKRENAAALAAYGAALGRAPELVADPALETNLEVMLDEKEPQVVLDAIDLLLLTHLGDDDAIDRLVQWATSHQDRGVRHRALKLADTHNVGDRVDRVASFSRDLADGATCEERREAVSKLRALGDRRAVEALTKASFVKGSDRKNINECLRVDAEEAVKYLQNLEVRDAGPPDAG
jgi:eukaryotic-like serine/threonine-protein kinase